jgi:MoCo/4Fe-4S cofactor protein with predicted Tat translocation signal
MRKGSGDREPGSEGQNTKGTARVSEMEGAGVAERQWRSLGEIEDAPELRALVGREFPGLAHALDDAKTRRAFLKLMGASLGVAGMTSCRWPKETILPFASRPEGRTPGVPQQFATALELGGAALGLLVTSFDGRPIKVEGNPLHPASQGAATAFAQASVLELYDPDRSSHVVRREAGQEVQASWDDFVAWAGPHFAGVRERQGAGLAILSEENSSLVQSVMVERMRSLLPGASWYEWVPLSRDNERAGVQLACGQRLRPLFFLGEADVIVCLDADPLFGHPDAVRHARELAAGRRGENGTMNRLYVAEGALSITGALADHRLASPPSQMGGLALALARELGRRGVPVPQLPPVPALPLAATEFAASAARDLVETGRQVLIVVGERQPAEVHALAFLLNSALGGRTAGTLAWVPHPAGARADHRDAVEALVASMAAGSVDTVLILGGNPVFDAPVDVAFAAALAKVPSSIHLSLFDNETSHACRWHVNRGHYLEAWGDARAWDGTVSVQQPLIEPLYGGKSVIEVLALLEGGKDVTGYDLIRRELKGIIPPLDFESGWRRALHDGVVANSGFAHVDPRAGSPKPGAVEATLAKLAQQPTGGLEVVFVPSSSVYDGRFANNAWLQEAPDPLTTITWDNAACFSVKTAQDLAIRHGDLVSLTLDGRTLEVAAYIMPGQADGTVVLPLGYGRTRAGRVGNGVGFDTYRLRSTKALWFASGLQVEKTGRRHQLACTQEHHGIDRIGFEERGQRIAELVREGTLAEYLADPRFVEKRKEEPKLVSLWQEKPLEGVHQWAMSIDLSACIGCNACVVACQAENNVPVVGKEQVARHREMHWLRLDRYFAGAPEAPRVAFQPVACQHCENAPCEQVCPVGATMHSDEGLNQMVYNRCVGTRYCSNNCPYKVRRFNFFNYYTQTPQVQKMVYNPEVTVRSRGVMEKCTFCIQRIAAAKIAAKNDRRPIRDGEVVPACAQTCPTEAIVFGDLKDPESRVAKLHAHERSYAMLGELNVKPRTRYLARLRNPASTEEKSE